ncbi:arsenate reductase (glutaredoxin) [Alteromonas facilis]|uniref:arsenate reductase (glutaredoxin) n=1 Tax=Alteromonas facilis TaxID=2048004 RepID=UPI000C28DB9B|nr:arsenate reductase (glutaredoxin) [Alteromonas facilis]
MQYLHNPRCSKSRQGLALLQEHGASPEVIEYLKEPLNTAQIEDIAKKLGIDDYRLMMRVKEAEYKENNLANADQSQLLAAMESIPKLIERPILITASHARIGRPPEALLELL